jgi:hypothetical protein
MNKKTTNAVIERFDGNIAIIESAKGDEYRIHRSQLPKGCHVGHHLQMKMRDGKIIQVMIDEKATIQTRKSIDELMEKLRRGEHLKKDDSL